MLKAEEVDAVLAVSCLGFTPQPPEEVPEDIRDRLVTYQKQMQEGEVTLMDGLIERMERYGKPLIIAAVSDRKQAKSIAKLLAHDIFTYRTPEDGARVIAYLVDYSRYLNQTV
jgi:acyl-CoA synthetase (NDP forming)